MSDIFDIYIYTHSQIKVMYMEYILFVDSLNNELIVAVVFHLFSYICSNKNKNRPNIPNMICKCSSLKGMSVFPL